MTGLDRDRTPAGTVRIGVSGWRYAPWRRDFYPGGLPQRRELAHASRHFGSIEINGTFYSLQRPQSFATWCDETPEGFVFAVKGSRYITHMKRLLEVEAALANFFASGVLALGPKLGPFLWQFPPAFRYERERLESFLSLLPRETGQAARLAERHDARVEGRAVTTTDAVRPIRHAIEIRHESFVVPDFVELLRSQRVALVCADTVEWPRLMDVTSDFVYCRLHGSRELYMSGYDEAELDLWASRVVAWATGRPPPDSAYAGGAVPCCGPRDVFLYFDNTDKKRAPADAQALIQRVRRHLGAEKVPPWYERSSEAP